MIFLARRNTSTAPAQLLTIEPANALLSLLPYSNFIRQLDPGEALRRIQPLADSVPAYDLGRGDLVRMVQQVERLIA